MDTRVTTLLSSSLREEVMLLCNRDYDSPIKSEPLEQQYHFFHSRQGSEEIISHLPTDASKLNTTHGFRSSYDHGLGQRHHHLHHHHQYRHHQQHHQQLQQHQHRQLQQHHGLTSHDDKPEAYGNGNDRDQSFHHQQRVHHNQPQTNQHSQAYHQHQHSQQFGRQQPLHHQHQQQQRFQHGSMNTQALSAAQRLQVNTKRRMIKEKAPKGDREEVWPPDVEGAFMKALEVLPKLGRRKVLVNGKPCGRNELIADFIFQQTQKVRDRKQVSSHIQVLKNTRKHDPAFLRLLMDGGDGDEEIEMTGPSNNGYASLSLSPIMISPSTQYDRSEQPIFDDRGQHISDASPSGAATAGGLNSLTGTDYHGYSVAHSQFRPPYKQQHSQENPPHARITSFSASDVGSDHMLVLSEDPESHSDSAPSIYQHSVTTPDSAVSLSSEMGMKEPVVMLKQENIEDSYRRSADGFGPSSFYGKDKVIRNPSAKPHQRSRSSSSSSSVTYPFWPTDFGLYLQYPVLSPDGISNSTGQQQQQQQQQQQRQQRQYLARANDLRPSRMRTINIHQLQPEKFPNLYDLYEKASSAWSCPFVFLKVGMDLNLELDGTFENTCLFESNVKGGEKPTTTTSNSHGDTNERRWSTVRCLTLIYSFGAKVLESTEVKQVKETGDEQKLIYSFEFVNQFFNAFLTGIRTLETMEEVEVALCNLSLVQIYEEVEATADARIEDPHQHHHHPLAATGAIGGVEAGGTGTGPVASGSPSPLLVMAFEFEKGRGTVLPYHVVDGSDMLETLMC